MKRERAKAREVMSTWSLEKHRQLQCFYFDGKKDATRVQEQRGDRLFPLTDREDHYVMTAPDGSFVGHITVPKKEDAWSKEAQRNPLSEVSI